MLTRTFRQDELEQLELFRPRIIRPSWHSLPSDAKERVTEQLAQLIAEYVSNQLAVSDRKELINE